MPTQQQKRLLLGQEGAAVPWWLSAGLAPVGAYAAKGAASLAASYVNLANPGTHDLTVGVAPTWDAVNGWNFTSGSQYLDTSIVPDNDQTMTMMVMFSNGSITGGSRGLAGAFHASNRYFGLYSNVANVDAGYINGQLMRVNPYIQSGNLALAGNKGYRNGIEDLGIISAFGGAMTRSIWIGGVNNGTLADGYVGNIQALAIWDSVLTPYQIAIMKIAMGNLAYYSPGLSYSAVFAPSDLHENGYSAQQSGYYDCSEEAFAKFTTDATALAVDINSTLYTSYPVVADINVRVDGADYAILAANQLGAQKLYTALPVGSKTVTLTSGAQSKPSGSVIGTYLVGIQANAPVTVVAPSPSGRLLIYGDSITGGSNATRPSRDNWAMLLRNFRGNVMLEAWGFRSLYDDINTAPLRAAFVARLASHNPSIIWLAIGTNDYGLNKWSATAFGTGLAATLDDLHAASPSTAIRCQSPITRTTETANGSGSTLGDYRTQISNAASARSSYCTYVDGTAWSIALDTDGLHPTTAGHNSYYLGVKAALGL